MTAILVIFLMISLPKFVQFKECQGKSGVDQAGSLYFLIWNLTEVKNTILISDSFWGSATPFIALHYCRVVDLTDTPVPTSLL